MNTDINKLTHEVINCAMEVSNIIGSGFTENVYDKARQVELGLILNFGNPKLEIKRVIND